MYRWRAGKSGFVGGSAASGRSPSGAIRSAIDSINTDVRPILSPAGSIAEGVAVNAWKVCCGKCLHTWIRIGNWSVYEREAVESRPCPKCHSYTLSSPEPAEHRHRPSRPHFPSFAATPSRRRAG